jgi:hypothetical protein
MCDLTGTVTDLVRTFTPIAALVAVGIGWVVVNRQNNARESRKETRQLVDRTLKYVADAVDIATRYQGASVGSRPAHVDGWKVLLALGQIRSNLTNLNRANVDMKSCIASYISLKQCITGGDFMTANWSPWPPTDRRWLDMLGLATKLSELLDRIFIDTYSK